MNQTRDESSEDVLQAVYRALDVVERFARELPPSPEGGVCVDLLLRLRQSITKAAEIPTDTSPSGSEGAATSVATGASTFAVRRPGFRRASRRSSTIPTGRRTSRSSTTETARSATSSRRAVCSPAPR